VVTDGVDGSLVAVGDVDAMAERLAALAADPAGRTAMGEAGRESVMSRYRVERLLDDVDALYRELLEAAGLPTPDAGTP
jgi:glycosyltransferase involved in cell wall biosynthesis